MFSLRNLVFLQKPAASIAGCQITVSEKFVTELVLGRTSNLPNLQKPNLEPTEPLIWPTNRTSNLPNLLKTEPNLETYTL